MVTIIKKGMRKEEIRSILIRLRKKTKKINLKKYCGAIKLEVDPLEQQKKWRNEWKQHIVRYEHYPLFAKW